MKLKITIFCLLFALVAKSQLLRWTPQFPNDNSTIAITMDASKGNAALKGFKGTVYLHLGVITNLSTSSTDWKHVTTTWGSTTAPTATKLDSTHWLYQLSNPRVYFNVGAGEIIYRIAILFRDSVGSLVQRNADGSDMYVPIYPAGTNGIQITQPYLIPTYNMTHEAVTAGVGQSFPVSAAASGNTGTLNLYFNGTKVAGPLTGTTTISANVSASSTGNQQIVSEFLLNGTGYYDTISYFITPPTVTAALPAGVKEGINYGADCSSATLVLYAPHKTNAFVIGDFAGSNWQLQTQYQMMRTPDSNYYWITINGLTSGVEYAFEYVVDNAIYIADPYSEKILDPWNDSYIPSTTYPNLRPYPSNANVSASKNGFVSILQTCQPAYKWKVPNFNRPDRKNLVTYELLVRDFGAARNYQMLIDTISYFKRLGINAIELMPVNEFTGNDSWGYNPTFYTALDKAYGTKDKFKEFIDLCHQNGIAIILDVVYNHLDAYNAPQGKLYWNSSINKPATNSPWFNVDAPHPYSVFNDFNHTSTATQYLVERSMEYWLSEYKVDGFRIDLAKGFTQTVSNTTTIENYDSSRVANLERYYDYIIARYPATYMILEFLGTQRPEEQEYAKHGFMLWGNNNSTYNQNTMGYSSNSDFSKIVYNSAYEAFTIPAEMGYMESHDEERLMYRNLTSGNYYGTYNVKDTATALSRQAAAAAVFFTVPGPKMFWQFGERGYDVSINYGGSNVASKPPKWEYMSDTNRLKLFDAYSKLISLRLANPSVFNNTNFSYDFYDNGGLFRRFQIADTSSKGIKVTVLANFDVVPQTRTITFQSTGNWYNYLSNGTGTGLNGPGGTTLNVTSAYQSVTLQPGEYHVYITHPASTYVFIGKGNWNTASNWTFNVVPPSILPSGSVIEIAPQAGGECLLNVSQTIPLGTTLKVKPSASFRIPGNLQIQ